MAEDAAVVLREMTEAAGGRLRSLCVALIALNPQIKNPNLIHIGDEVRVS